MSAGRAEEIGALTLDRLRFGAHMMMPAAAAEDLSVDVIADVFTDSLLARLRADVLAETLPPQKITHPVTGTFWHTVPAGPWQLFKAMHGKRWFMRWRHWTVRYTPSVEVAFTTHVSVDVRNAWTYPRAAVRLPREFGPPVLHAYVESVGAEAADGEQICDRRCP